MPKKKRGSEVLDATLQESVPSQIDAKLLTLEALGVDPDLLADFKQRVIDIIQEFPWNQKIEEIVDSELKRTAVQMEGLQSRSRERKRGMLIQVANQWVWGESYV